MKKLLTQINDSPFYFIFTVSAILLSGLGIALIYHAFTLSLSQVEIENKKLLFISATNVIASSLLLFFCKKPTTLPARFLKRLYQVIIGTSVIAFVTLFIRIHVLN